MPSAPPTSSTEKVWPVSGTGLPGTGTAKLAVRAMNRAPATIKGDVADSRTDPLADLDRYEEIGDRDAALAGGRPIESGQGDRQLRLQMVGRAFGDRRPESSIRSPDPARGPRPRGVR